MSYIALMALAPIAGATLLICWPMIAFVASIILFLRVVAEVLGVAIP